MSLNTFWKQRKLARKKPKTLILTGKNVKFYFDGVCIDDVVTSIKPAYPAGKASMRFRLKRLR